jgi:exodeoxyribonuclease VII large subunit
LLLERRRARLEHAAGRLRALSPRRTLDRGYAIVRSDGGVVRAASELARGQSVAVELAHGSFDARVEGTRE